MLSGTIHNNITPVILAGGLGTRLKQVLPGTQKVIAPVKGRPFIHYLLDMLNRYSFQKAVICTGYRSDTVSECLGKAAGGLKLIFSKEPEPLDTAGALRLAVKTISTPFILAMNGDSYIQADLKAYMEWHFSNDYENSMILAKVDDVSRYGYVETGTGNQVVQFSEKGAYSGPGLINAGIYLLDSRMITSLPENKPYSLEKQVFPDLCKTGLYGYVCSRPLIDIGTPDAYKKAQKINYHETF